MLNYWQCGVWCVVCGGGVCCREGLVVVSRREMWWCGAAERGSSWCVVCGGGVCCREGLVVVTPWCCRCLAPIEGLVVVVVVVSPPRWDKPPFPFCDRTDPPK